ncbi:CAP domain-containing protein [Apiospora marii]|uniref:CAP domain-containing protein n=1 Tax=Apiospora marii TaxID=335849 RepID=A0ABR1RBS6_9PEZI
MKSSIFIAGASALIAMASPVDKRDIVTKVDVVEVWDTVTVTAGEPTPTPAPATTTAAPPAPTEPAAKAPAIKQAFAAPKQKAQAPAEPEVVIVTVTGEEPQPTQAPAPPAPTAQAEEPDVVIVTVSASPDPQPQAYTQAPAPAPEPTTYEPAPVASEAPTPNRPVYANKLATAAVNSHNQHRSNHSAPEATWNERIAGYAAITASSCKYAHDMKQGDADYGQNIAMWGLSAGAEKLGDVGAINMAITDMWYNGEVGLYLPSFYGEASPDMGNFEKWGHFSQLVWKKSTGVGCQAQFCPKGTMNDAMDTWFMVCNYYPAGNMGGGYGENVMRPLGKANIVASASLNL